MKKIKSILFFGLLFHSFVFAAEFNVNDIADTDDNNAGDGICATIMGGCTLRAAITEANSFAGADTINLPSGIYNTSSSLSITSAITIIGENPDTTIVDANDSARVFSINNSQPLTMSGFTIQGGNAGTSGHGGGIFINSSNDVTLSGMNISNNSANVGGGIASGSQANQLDIVASVIEQNSGITGGAGPSTSWGGAIHFGRGTITITGSTIRDNTADVGGALHIGSSFITDLTIRNTTVSNNTATVQESGGGAEMGGNGGAIHQGGAATKIINSTISNNKAFNSGGGIILVNGFSSVSLFNTTIVNNIADFDENGNGQGGGIFGGPLSGGGGLNLELSNSIVAENISNSGVGPDCQSTTLGIISNGYNIIGNNTNCSFIANVGDQIGDSTTPFDPMTGPLADNGGSTFTHALLAGSPAIDAGNPTGCVDNNGVTINTDQRGETRPLDGGGGTSICDIGAYETIPYPIADAGDDQVVAFGDTVFLTGTGSSAASGIALYSWVQLPSETVTLVDATTDTASFVAPDASTVLTFELTVIDNNGAESSDTVTVAVNQAANQAPGNSTPNNSSTNGGGGGAGPIILLLLIGLITWRKQKWNL